MTNPEDENPIIDEPQPPQKPDPGPNDEPDPDFGESRIEDDMAAFRRQLDELHFTAPERGPQPASAQESLPLPAGTEPAAQSTLRRRRRTARLAGRPDASELGERFESIVRRAAPTFDFFVFSFFSACVLAIGYILDAPAVLIMGILVAPLLAPWVNTALSLASGELRLFGQTLGGVLIALLTVFGVGLLAGLASRLFQPLTSSQAFYHSRLWWPDLLMLIIGSVLMVFAFIQSDDKPLVASLMVAYEIYLPASAAGFGLGSGVEGLWPQAGLVLMVHAALSLVVSLIVFFYMGFRPIKFSGYLLAAIAITAGLLILASFAGVGSLINVQGEQSSATPLASQTPSPIASSLPASLATKTPMLTQPATASVTPLPPATLRSSSGTPTQTTTATPTLLPTPIYGKVQSESGGVMVRMKPGGTSITTVMNGYLAEILEDPPVKLNGVTWVHVIIKTPSGDINGWVILDLILMATPSGSP